VSKGGKINASIKNITSNKAIKIIELIIESDSLLVSNLSDVSLAAVARGL
jgi:hypothetical protein